MKVWIEKPVSISNPPKKDGRYMVVGCDNDVDYVYFSVDFGWACKDGYFTHYLVPIEVDHVLTDKELEELKSKAVQEWAERNKFLLNPHKQILPNI